MDYARILRSVRVAMQVHAYGPTDPVQFFYMDALNALIGALWCDGTFIAARKFSVSRFWDVVRTHQATIISTIASMPVWLLKAAPTDKDRETRVRFGIHSQVPRELHEVLDERWGFGGSRTMECKRPGSSPVSPSSWRTRPDLGHGRRQLIYAEKDTESDFATTKSRFERELAMC